MKKKPLPKKKKSALTSVDVTNVDDLERFATHCVVISNRLIQDQPQNHNVLIISDLYNINGLLYLSSYDEISKLPCERLHLLL